MKARRSRTKPSWAYAYAIVPPQHELELSGIRTFLEQAHTEARRAARTWTGNLVYEQEATHILVVSDSPDQGRPVNRRLERRLRQLNVVFSLTLPMSLCRR